jgi:hypothetical protein
MTIRCAVAASRGEALGLLRAAAPGQCKSEALREMVEWWPRNARFTGVKSERADGRIVISSRGTQYIKVRNRGGLVVTR